ncbi:MAG: hypothetical protein GVY06_01315 [Alphaproteobacteria bacterium]|jgi:hypothetical protein|nr:hypothetical protein [Alphaproteobacteria bacterium]
MHPIFLALALLALFGVHLARVPARGGLAGVSAAFLTGLVATALLLRLALGGLGVGRTTDFDRVVNAAVAAAQDEDTPLILFAGASYSRNAIDDARLTRQLKARGHPHRVINLSLEAASMMERAAHLEQFMDRSGRVPDIVFIEVARDFDLRVAQFFGNSKFSVRGIEQFGPKVSFWTARGLLGGACQGMTGCVKDGAFLAAHSGLNLLNVGLAARGERAEAAGRLDGYDPQTEPREEIDLMDRAIGLSARPEARERSAPDWARAYRLAWRTRLEERGVRTVGYYFPPVIDPARRAYVSGLCDAELDGSACFAPQDAALLRALDAEVWFDAAHLLDPGAAVYTSWLAARLAESGLLSPGPAGQDGGTGPP